MRRWRGSDVSGWAQGSGPEGRALGREGVDTAKSYGGGSGLKGGSGRRAEGDVYCLTKTNGYREKLISY